MVVPSHLQLSSKANFDFHPVRPVHPVPSQTCEHDWVSAGMAGLSDGEQGQWPSKVDRVDRADRVKIKFYFPWDGAMLSQAMFTPLRIFYLKFIKIKPNPEGSSSATRNKLAR